MLGMDIHSLRLVYTICRYGSFSKAGAALNISQPTISKNIARLEDQISAPLFERSRGKSAPTSLALFLAERAEKLLEECGLIEKEIQSFISGETGVVRIGFGPVPAKLFLSEYVLMAKQKYPDISMVIISASGNDLLERLGANELDFVICHEGTALVGAKYDVEPLLDIDVALVVPPDHPALLLENLTARAIFDFPFALPVMTPYYRMMLTSIYGIDLERQSDRIYSTDYDILIQLAEKNGYVTAVPEPLIKKILQSGKLVDTGVRLRNSHQLVIAQHKSYKSIPSVTNCKALLNQLVTGFMS